MAIALQPITLNSEFGDGEARLAMRDGRLFAILSCLGDLHGELVGHWFVETVFGEGDGTVAAGQTFTSLGAFEAAAG